MMAGTPYLLGNTSAEHQRLMRQGAFLADLTRQLFVAAGIGPGMRVLDVGCGVGDVSFVAGELVGPGGTVVGIDRDPAAVALARERAAAAGLRHVRFEVGDACAPPVEGKFDAVVGRLILLYLGDVPAALRRLAALVGPGGRLVFQEMVMTGGRSVPPLPVFSRMMGWLAETF